MADDTTLVIIGRGEEKKRLKQGTGRFAKERGKKRRKAVYFKEKGSGGLGLGGGVESNKSKKKKKKEKRVYAQKEKNMKKEKQISHWENCKLQAIKDEKRNWD